MYICWLLLGPVDIKKYGLTDVVHVTHHGASPCYVIYSYLNSWFNITVLLIKM